MFQLYKYSIISSLREKSTMFWSLIFPIVLGTLFYVAFGNLASTDSYNSVIDNLPIAVVETQSGTQADTFKTMLDELQSDSMDYLEVEYTSMDNAKEMLSNSEIDGIIEIDDTIKLIVKEEGITQSLLKTLVDQYLQMEQTVMTIIEEKPEQLENVTAAMSQELDLNKEISLTESQTNNTIQYFYALIAMSCLFGAFFGIDKVIRIQANQSSLGARRSIAPTTKMKLIISDFLSSITIQYFNTLILLAFLIFVLKIDFSNQVQWILLTSFAGSVAGIALGTLLGLLIKGGLNLKYSLTSAIVMVLCFFSGLMVATMQNIVEHTFPIFNRINPAVLIKDAFYCLNVYDNLDRYFQNIISLIIITVILCFINIMIMRREKYASI